MQISTYFFATFWASALEMLNVSNPEGGGGRQLSDCLNTRGGGGNWVLDYDAHVYRVRFLVSWALTFEQNKTTDIISKTERRKS